MFVNQHENRPLRGGDRRDGTDFYYSTNTWGGGGQTEGTSPRRGHGGRWRRAMAAPPLRAFPPERNAPGQDSPLRPSGPGQTPPCPGEEGPACGRWSSAGPRRGESPAAASAAVPSTTSPRPRAAHPASRRHPDLRRPRRPASAPAPPPPRGRGPGRAVQRRRPPARPPAAAGAPPGRGGLRAVPHGLCGHVSADRCSVRPAGPEPGSGAGRRQSRYCHHRKLRRHLIGGRLRETCLLPPSSFADSHWLLAAPSDFLIGRLRRGLLLGSFTSPSQLSPP